MTHFNETRSSLHDFLDPLIQRLTPHKDGTYTAPAVKGSRHLDLNFRVTRDEASGKITSVSFTKTAAYDAEDILASFDSMTALILDASNITAASMGSGRSDLQEFVMEGNHALTQDPIAATFIACTSKLSFIRSSATQIATYDDLTVIDTPQRALHGAICDFIRSISADVMTVITEESRNHMLTLLQECGKKEDVLDSVVTRFQPIARGIGFGLRRGTKRSSLRTAWQYRASA